MVVAHRVADVRAAEQPLLDAGVPLMEHAAFALACAVAREVRARRDRLVGARVLLLVGAGSNGGDALHAGAVLAGWGAAVTAVTTADRVHAEGADALRRAGGRLEPLDPARHPGLALAADVVVDGLLGIGASGALRGEVAELVRRVQAGRHAGDRGPLVVAVDVPSGIGVDDGTLPATDAGDAPVLAADLTVTFGTAKPGLLLPPADALAGRLRVVDIGLDLVTVTPAVRRLDAPDLAAGWPVPGWTDHKYTRGVLGVVAGTAAYPGAAVLACSAAVRAGVGMVRYLGPDTVAHAVLAARPEVVVGDGRVQAWLLGPGVDPDDAEQTARVRDVLARLRDDSLPVVLDAGALAVLPEEVAARGPLTPLAVLTPHAGEAATLLTALGRPTGREDVEAEPARCARELQRRSGATVLLKGATTVVAGPADPVLAQADGPAWLATAGSGDVLAGLLGALLAARGEALAADPAATAALAALAAAVHGRAGHTACPDGPVSALAVADALPGTVAALLT